MGTKGLQDILRPYDVSVPIEPSIRYCDSIIYGIEVMLDNNLRYISVLQNNHPIGILFLKDALNALGIKTQI